LGRRRFGGVETRDLRLGIRIDRMARMRSRPGNVLRVSEIGVDRREERSSILVVCSGNLCRSPLAEALLRRLLEERFGSEAPMVRSAGTIAIAGSAATPQSVRVAAEHGLDTSTHTAARLEREMIGRADLIVAMAAEHRDQVAMIDPEAIARTFTLKELVRLLGELPAPPAEASLVDRIGEADELRGHSLGIVGDDDIVDPIGSPIETYRAVAWELSTWIQDLVDGLFGPADDRMRA
jgi:protein-tyrosine phosphatase